MKLEYDGLVLADGADPKIKRVRGLSKGDNRFMLNQKKDYEELATKLRGNKIKDLVVLGYNTKSLQFIKTIHK